MRSSERENSLALGRVDWVTVAVYAALVLMGWLNIYAAVYDDAHASIFDIGQRYGMQMVWIGISAFIALSILLIDDKYSHVLAYPLYWLSLLLLIGVLFFGKEVNGAKSWIMIGPVALQPTEFVKFTTALALARQVAMYIARETTNLSYKAIGESFGKDHTTVLHNVKCIENFLRDKPYQKELVDDIIKNLKSDNTAY